MRVAIREQLSLVILLSSLIGLGVISIATWYTVHDFILDLRSTRLSLVATLKAAQLSSNVALMQTSVQLIANRLALQNALKRYNAGNNTESNWVNAVADMDAALGGDNAIGGPLLLQAIVFPQNTSGLAGSDPVLLATGASLYGTIRLPYDYPNGTACYLGDSGIGYPPALYPNVTYAYEAYNSTYDTSVAYYEGQTLDYTSQGLMIGPWSLNESFSLVSLTMPVINNTSAVDVIAWLTVVLDARLISDVISADEGLDSTAELLLIGPTNRTNHYPPDVLYTSLQQSSNAIDQQEVHFVLPLFANESARHPGRTEGAADTPFALTQYPSLLKSVTNTQGTLHNYGSNIATTNEAGKKVSVGFSQLDTPLCDWTVIIEEARAEVWAPIVHLRKVLLACVFGTLGFMILLAFPLAHFFSSPIRQLRSATMKSVMPPGYSESSTSLGQYTDTNDSGDDNTQQQIARKEGFLGAVTAWRKRGRKTRAEHNEEVRRRQFRIPGKVKERKHIIHDELSDLTRTFNEMSDELMMQYERLEERVQQRTAELELSKKAAETANESKTLFIANISHELKTPLNGILGMCAVCMQEDDPVRLKRSLGIIYKSGDLLLNLLTDLLTFSKNQVGQHLSLDEKEFRLRDISSQVLAIFDKQAKEGQIDLRVNFQGSFDRNEDEEEGYSEIGPAGTGRVKDMVLWGDQHRILQVVINLVSNSLKFTPPGGSVTLSVRCLGEAPDIGSRKSSMGSKVSKPSRKRGSDSSLAGGNRMDTAGALKTGALITAMERPAAPPPGRNLQFEFEVEDTGPGIPEDQHRRIFEPFVQGDLGLSKKYGGTGLGLSICSQLAGLMRGTMGIESEVGRGSTFNMRIPLRHLVTRTDSSASSMVDVTSSARPGDEPSTPRYSRDKDDKSALTCTQEAPVKTKCQGQTPLPGQTQSPRQPESQPRLVGLSQPYFASSTPMESPGSQPAAMEQISATANSSPTRKIRVLVAEDNKVNQEVVTRMLKLEDIYDVTIAQDGQEALDLVKESMANGTPFQTILMDICMPNLDGIEATRRIRELGFDAPIVALTALSGEGDIKDCFDSGMNYFLSKPIRRPALKKVLKEYCAPILEVDEDNDVGDDAKYMQQKTHQNRPLPTPQDKKVDFAMTGQSQATTFESHGTAVVIGSRPNSIDGPLRGSSESQRPPT